MPKSPGKPVLGAVLGAALGAIVLAILQQGAVVLPTRLISFGTLGLCAGVGSLLLTVTYRSRTVVAVQSAAVLFLAFALTGIPTMSDAGSIEGGCTASAQLSGASIVTPADTSVFRPFAAHSDDILAWQAGTPAPFSDWAYSIRFDIAGFPIEVWSDTEDEEGAIGPSWEGVEDLSLRIGELEDISGLTITGVYHLWGSVRGDEGACDIEVYVRIPPDHLFDGPILVGLWTAASIALLIFTVYAKQVRGARRLENEEDPGDL